MGVADRGIVYNGESERCEQNGIRRLGHEVDPFLEIVEGAVIVWDGIGMTGVAKSPIKAGVGSSKVWKSKGIAGFKGFVANDVGVGGFVVTVVISGGSVSVSHLSG